MPHIRMPKSPPLSIIQNEYQKVNKAMFKHEIQKTSSQITIDQNKAIDVIKMCDSYNNKEQK